MAGLSVTDAAGEPRARFEITDRIGVLHIDPDMRREPALLNPDATIHWLHQEVAARDKTIGWWHAEVAERDKIATWLHAELAERDRTIAWLRGELSARDRDATIHWLHQEVTARDETIGWLHAEVAERDKTVTWLHAEVSERDRTIAWLHGEIRVRDRILAEAAARNSGDEMSRRTEAPRLGRKQRAVARLVIGQDFSQDSLMPCKGRDSSREPAGDLIICGCHE